MSKPIFRKRRSQNTNMKNRKFKKAVQQIISKNIETKTLGFGYINNPIGNSASGVNFSIDLTGISEGSGQLNRLGNNIHVTGLWSDLTYTAGFGDVHSVIRCILYIPKDANDVISSVDIYSLVDLDKYTILYDDTINMVEDTSTHFQRRVKKWSFTRGGKRGISVQWHGNTALQFAKNPLRWYFVSNSGAVAHPTMSGRIRLYFKDA